MFVSRLSIFFWGINAGWWVESSANKFVDKSKSKIIQAQKVLGCLYEAENI